MPSCTSFGVEAGIASLLKRRGAIDASSIGKILGASAGAVRGAIDTMTRLGCVVRHGDMYGLNGDAPLLLPWEIAAGADTALLGRHVYFFDSMPSTQDYALGLSAEPGAVVISGEQTSGRGRLGREWVSPPGGVWMSVVLRPGMDPDVLTLLPAAVSVAVCRAMSAVLDRRTEIRWPNDIMYGGAKIGGIIIDAEMEGGGVRSLVVGVGVNLDVDASLILDAVGSDERVSAVRTRTPGERRGFVCRLLKEMECVDGRLREGRTGDIVSEWTRHSCTIGRRVPGRYGGGRAIRLDPDGALVVGRSSGTARITAVGLP